MTDIQIANRLVGPGHPAFCIAEVGLAHDGSLGQAHAYIDAAADCGFDAVKFQTHFADFESTAEERFRVNVFPQDDTRPDYWKRTAFTKVQWKSLAEHALERDLVFLSSPFSNEAVDLLLECEVSAWKVASGEVTNLPMLRRMMETGLPLLLSSGMSGWSELVRIVSAVGDYPVALFQCTSAYPCPPEQWGLNVVAEMQRRFECPVGLSDHSGTIVPGIAAVAQGASLIEVHIAFSKQQFGPDSKASLNLEQAVELVSGVRQLSEAMSKPVDKDSAAEKLAPLRLLFMKSIVAARRLDSGHIVTQSDLAFKKPGTGVPADQVDQIIGRQLQRSVREEHIFSMADFS